MIRTLLCCMSAAALLLSSTLGALSDCERLEAFETLVAKDSKRIPRHLERWLDAQTVLLEPSSITGDYGSIKEMVGRISKHIKKPAFVCFQDENRSKNALPDMPVIDETRSLRHLGNFYLNANDVLTLLQEYIVGQAPLEATLPDFWRAVIEAKVTTIVALAMPSDAGGRHPPYWEIDRFPVSLLGWTIQQQGAEEVLDTSLATPSQRVVKRLFLAINEETKETRTITHIHYENWPDNGAPEPLLFYRFIHLVSTLHPSASSPLFVHCAAGIGRSGTFVASHSLCKEIEALHPSTINIPKRIVDLRMQRAYVVSTVVQFAAIYEVVRHCVQNQEAEREAG